MKIETQCSHVTPSDGNVFADLGFDPKEAKYLQEKSRIAINEELSINSSFTGIETNNMNQNT